jgi:hypothetical protein
MKTYSKEYLKKIATTLAKKKDVAKVWNKKSPKNKKPWVGVEIEFYTGFEHIGRIIANSDIAKYVCVGDDGSIEINYDKELPARWWENKKYSNLQCYEMKICAPEDEIFSVMGKACAILRHIDAKTNNSCGLHIHIDHRTCTNRNPVITFNNLSKLQPILFGVTEGREDCGFCNPVEDELDFYQHMFNQLEESEYDDESRYYAINLLALRDTNTIEVRVFNGTTKYREIAHYLNVVLGAAKSKPVMKLVDSKNVDIVKSIPINTRRFVKNKMRKAA